MTDAGRKIAIVGAGIAGLCAAVYAQQCGYQTEVFEMHETPGGLATSWRRGDYTFETCLHWLLGASPTGQLHSRWREVLDIDKLTFLTPEEYVRVQAPDGTCLHVYSNIDRLEAEMLKVAPQDKAAIHHFASATRSLANFRLPDSGDGLFANWMTYLHDVPYLHLLKDLSSQTCEEYGSRFTNPLLRSFFGHGDLAQLSVVALVLSLGWMSEGDAAYPIGGSQAVIRLIVQKLENLGGKLRLGAKVKRILVENDTAVGLELENGERIAADWVISAADGHATVFDLLEGKYLDQSTEELHEDFETFPSYLQVSLGVARDLSSQPGFLTRLLNSPLEVDPGTRLNQISFRIFHYDPTFAPAGKTSVTCFLPTRNFEYWTHLHKHEHAAYEAEKHRIAEAVIAILGKNIPDLRQSIEVVDVSTPATVIHYTGNWKGSMEGWLMTPQTKFGALPNTLPGLRNFFMAGQWVMPGGGLPSGLMTARAAIQSICKHGHVPFLHSQHEEFAAASLYPF